MKVIGIIQARMSSTRLPGKVLLEAAGKPLLLHMLERVSRSRYIDEVWIATSQEKEDDTVAEVIKKAGGNVFRGSLDNVLSRFYLLGKQRKADIIVRLTGDCPLHDPDVIDLVIGYFLNHKNEFDYVSNVLPPTYPDGLDTEIFSFNCLSDAYFNAVSSFDLEHVVPYIRRVKHEDRRIGNFLAPADFSHLRWTLDESEDYDFIKAVFDELHPSKEDFGWLDVLAWMTKEPRRFKMNSRYKRNEGLQKSRSYQNQGQV